MVNASGVVFAGNACSSGHFRCEVAGLSSDVTLLRQSLFALFPGPQKKRDPSVSLRSFGNNVQVSVGSFNAKMVVSDLEEYEVCCQVMPDRFMNVYDMLIGKNLLKGASMTVVNGVVRLEKLRQIAEEANDVWM